MMKSPTSLIRFRNAVGVLLAMSAVFAVVISTISMPGDKALGQMMTNEDEVQSALDALEAAVADPDLDNGDPTAAAADSGRQDYSVATTCCSRDPTCTGTSGMQPDTDNDGTQ